MSAFSENAEAFQVIEEIFVNEDGCIEIQAVSAPLVRDGPTFEH